LADIFIQWIGLRENLQHIKIMGLSCTCSNPLLIQKPILIGALEHEFYVSIQLGMSSSQLTNPTNPLLITHKKSTTEWINIPQWISIPQLLTTYPT